MRHSRFARYFLLFAVIGPLAILVFGGIVMLLWNNVLAEVLRISTINFWQALGILVLSKILFSSFGSGGRSRGDYWKQRMMWKHMTPEQKEKFKEEWKSRSHRWGYKSGESDAEQMPAGS